MERALVLAVALTALAAAHAQDWPKAKPIQLVVAAATGSSTDIVARLVAPRLSEAIGQPVVLHHRSGAGGNVGAQEVKAAARDGYTLLISNVAIVVNAALYANPGYELHDFAPVILGPSTPHLIAVHPALPARNVQELVKLAREEPLSYASAGVGSAAHLSMERLRSVAKFEATHVPFPPVQAAGAAVAGHTQIASTLVPPAVTHVRGGRLRPLAVTSARRSPLLPEVPTLGEQGFPGFDDLMWTGFFARAGTPHDIVNRLNSELNAALLLPELQQRLAKHRLDWKSNTPGEFADFLRGEAAKWAQAVRASGAKAD